MTTKEEKVKSKMEIMIEEARKKNRDIEAQILLAGGRIGNNPLITLDSELQAIKDILFRNGLISEEGFELEKLKKTQILLTRLLEVLEDMKKKKSKILIPNMIPPKDMRKVRA